MRPALLPMAVVALLSASLAAGASFGAHAGGDLDADTEGAFTLPLHQEPKSIWPELVGWPGEEAKAHIEAQLPAGSLVIVIAEDMMMTMDYRVDRVRIIVGRETGRVVAPPRIG